MAVDSGIRRLFWAVTSSRLGTELRILLIPFQDCSILLISCEIATATAGPMDIFDIRARVLRNMDIFDIRARVLRNSGERWNHSSLNMYRSARAGAAAARTGARFSGTRRRDPALDRGLETPHAKRWAVRCGPARSGSSSSQVSLCRHPDQVSSHKRRRLAPAHAFLEVDAAR